MNKYYFVRYRWFKQLDMKAFAIEMDKKFSVEKLNRARGRDFPVFHGFLEELKVTADNLKVFLSPKRAVLFQTEPSPFTARDIELRKIIFEQYPRNKITPLPFFYTREPEFEIVEEPNK